MGGKTVVVNCCSCQEGNYLNTNQYVQCFNCGHVLSTCCPLAGESKTSRAPMATFDAAAGLSSFEASTSASDHGSYESYHSGYHYRK